MKSFTIASIFALAASSVMADFISTGNGNEVQCTGVNYSGNFCQSDNGFGDLIIRCYEGMGQEDNCADELDTPDATCNQSSSTAGDAQCYSSEVPRPTASSTATSSTLYSIPTATAVAGRVRL